MAGGQAMAQEEMSLEEAAKKSNNPVSDAWLLITQNDYTLLDTPDGTKWQNATTFQPVLPIPIFDQKWNLVNRIITGVVSSPVAEDLFNTPATSGLSLCGAPSLTPCTSVAGGVDPGNLFNQRTTGNTDTVVFSLLSPNRDDGFIWGVGPTFQVPTATQDVLGSEKWSAGPAAIVARLGSKFGEPGSIDSWNLGFLSQHWWDFAGDDDREGFNQSNIQYFINYKYNATQLIGMTPNILINWKESGSDRFSVPVGLGTIGFFRWGKVPVRWGVELQYYVQQPDNFGPDWNFKVFLAPIAPNPFK